MTAFQVLSERLVIVYVDRRDPQFKEMLELLAMLKKGHCDGLKVRIGRLQNLISSSCIGEVTHSQITIIIFTNVIVAQNIWTL